MIMIFWSGSCQLCHCNGCIFSC